MKNPTTFHLPTPRSPRRWSALALLAAALFSPLAARASNPAQSLFEPLVVAPSAAVETFPLVATGKAAPLWFDAADHKGVLRAVGALQADIAGVTGLTPTRSA